MFGPFERAVAARYLRARRGERFASVIALFSLIGIALGVATLIIVMSVMGGFKVDLLSRIIGFNGDLGVYGAGGQLADYTALAQRIQKLPGVVSAVPVLDGQVLLTGPRGSAGGGFVRGIGPADLKAQRLVSSHIVAGSLDNFKGDDAIAIGSGMARQFGVGVNDRITLVSPQGAATAFGTIPRVRAYRIVAIFNVGEFAYDSSYAFMPLSAAQVYFQKLDAVTQIEVRVQDPERVAAASAAVRTALAGAPITVIDWQHSNNSFFTAVQVEQNVMFVILALIILVAAFNVISSLIMMVKDKTRDIAVLRTIGAGRGAVMRIFLMCGASVGVVGTVIGTMLGLVFTWNIDRIQDVVQRVTGVNVFNPEVYYLTHLPARLDWNEVWKIVVMALALSLLATLYPSWRAARTDPVEALRHE
ncbi:MAG TPA: lipoprotein-releasing ABC transporter permease subunit [Acetobacteraceae bacterium]|nr:lipoprotein-releasing ABC transporter permease subunit [Acetobacteraceae bacterium]